MEPSDREEYENSCGIARLRTRSHINPVLLQFQLRLQLINLLVLILWFWYDLLDTQYLSGSQHYVQDLIPFLGVSATAPEKNEESKICLFLFEVIGLDGLVYHVDSGS